MRFNDHFSAGAGAYARFRPNYPDRLIDYLSGLAPARGCAWDCATGNGQVAHAHFDRVIATDASAEQIARATAAANVEYRVAPAESSGLPNDSIDLITVAQALHWFDIPTFYREAERVLKPDGIIAIWCYSLLAIEPDIDTEIKRFYENTVGPHWPEERRLVETGYASLAFPFPTIGAPSFEMASEWTLDELLGYVGTWSATARYQNTTGRDPLPPLRSALLSHWEAHERKRVVWPLSLRVGQAH